MNEGVSPAGAQPVSPPVSAFMGPVAEMIQQRLLSPPGRPGMLATLDHFEVQRLIGAGGMGMVLLARDVQGGREVAIKLIRSELVGNQQLVHRFLKEAGHLKRLRHTNIVPVTEISERAEGPYFVMPYFEKGSLAGQIKPGQPLPTARIFEIAMALAEGLGFAHRSGIIHRDLKPANILMGANGEVCIGDFGLARTVFNDTIVDVETRNLEGTAPYMSPAVAAGTAEDTRCDIYSFGAVLYEMLTGEPPYQGRGTKEILDQILAGPPRPITSLNPEADRGLVAVAETAMARELRDRYAEMRDVLSDLQRLKQGKPPTGGRSARVRPRALAVEIAACVLGVILLGWMLIRQHAASRAKPAPAAVIQPSAAATSAIPVVAKPPVVQPPAPQPSVAPPPPRVMVLAGQPGVSGFADGPGAQARFHLPSSVALDHLGNVYVADTGNNVIRKITPDGAVSTFAGAPGAHGSADGNGGQAQFWAPFGLAVDSSDTIYVADSANNLIRKITPDGRVTTLAGSAGHPGHADGVGSEARFRNPWSVTVDRAGNVYVADMSNDAIRKIAPNGAVTTVAGEPGMSGIADGFGPNARFNDPFAVAADGAGNIYVSDSGNDAIRKISPEGIVVTLAGKATHAGSRDGNAETARFWNPEGLAVDGAGNLYVADTGNNLIRKVTPLGVVSTLSDLAGTNAVGGSPAGQISLNSPGGIAVDRAGNLYIADSNNHCIRKDSAPR
jgi:sugar lactone lactonase YvrE